MTLQPDDTLEATPATRAETASSTDQTASVLDDTLPLVLNRDSIQLLVQSPGKLFLYWSFATDPRTTLRRAFGELAAQYRLTVRLVKVESGEEFLLDAPRERMQWFEVYPRHVYRAEVGFHAAGRPFVRLLSSKEVRTPPDSASQLSDAEGEFRVGAGEFARLLGGAGYENYARGLESAAGEGDNGRQNDPVALIRAASEGAGAPQHAFRPDTDEYPHR